MMLLALDTGGKLISRDVVISQNLRKRLCSVQIRTTYYGGIDLYAAPY